MALKSLLDVTKSHLTPLSPAQYTLATLTFIHKPYLKAFANNVLFVGTVSPNLSNSPSPCLSSDIVINGHLKCHLFRGLT